MGMIDEALKYSCAYPLTTILTISSLFILAISIYRTTLHPLCHIPGPILPKLTSLWLYYHTYIGDEATAIHEIHKQYGPIVRVSPREVDISDPDAIPSVYITKGGFPKAPCYQNFIIDGHATIFSTLDPEYRAPRAKAVVPLFSTKCIRENEDALYGCVDRMVERMREEKGSRKPVNVLNLARSLAIDVVTTHLFGENYNGAEEKGAKLSASAFVDAIVAFGRFFYLPNWAFSKLEWFADTFFMDEHTISSMDVMNKYVDSIVDKIPASSQTYPGRLTALGLKTSEVKAQCKDVMFAGTDSSGMNLATICRLLAMHPEKYQVLREEILSNIDSEGGQKKQDVYSLPYLTAVVHESLRLSMANPTRLPHIVPSSGFAFKNYLFPPGTIIGCSAYELHFNPTAFPNPHSFEPERWLEGNVTEEATKHWFAFGAGSRACIARNLAERELVMATERLVLGDVLSGARAVQEKVVIKEWFNSKVVGEKIELIWDGKES